MTYLALNIQALDNVDNLLSKKPILCLVHSDECYVISHGFGHRTKRLVLINSGEYGLAQALRLTEHRNKSIYSEYITALQHRPEPSEDSNHIISNDE